ncbi:MAG TPA: glycosyltransferase family 4 protein [Tepidisphaeraceae bacterium]
MTTDTVGGVWQYALELARALRPHGVAIALATSGAALSTAQRAQASRLSNVTLFESTYKLEWMDEPWDDVRRTADWLRALEAMFRPDLIHLNGYAYATGGFRAPVLTVGHSCVLSWFEAVRNTPAPPLWDRYRDAVTNGLRSADYVVAPSRAMLAALQTHYGPLPDAGVIYNGRDAADFAAAPKQDVVLTVGRVWDDAKNIDALGRISGDVPWPIRVAGDVVGPEGSAASTDGLQILGRLDERALASQFAQAAIYAMPARYEPFGLSVLEAALSRCALVLGDIPSLCEIWDDAAVYVPPNDDAALRTAILELIDAPDRRARLAERAYDRAARYGSAAMGRAYLAIYHTLANRVDRAASRPTGVLCDS